MQTEYGSDFHFIDFFKEDAGPSMLEIYPESRFFFSGRSALFNLIQSGIKLHNWQNIYLPEYYCHDVDAFIKALPVNIYYYDDGPYNIAKIDLSVMDKKTNVFIHVNYFGFNTCSRLMLENAFVIEDHTHDLTSGWALTSMANYCFASLRKSLPVPAGGIIWSPQKMELPEIPGEKELSNVAVYMKLSAMLLKKSYVETGNIDKQDFRDLFINSESLFEKHETNGGLPAVIQTIIGKIPIQKLRERKTDNYKYLSASIKEKNIVWHQQQTTRMCPFGFILYFNEEEKRDAMRAHLIHNRIYPAVLWPNQKEQKAKDFSSKSLFIHCDIRYNLKDMEAIAEAVNNYRYGN